jgi:hypothetical protein
MMVASPLLADSVYSWTDEDGVRHYSNTGIPSGVQEAEERPEEISSSPGFEPGQPSGNEGSPGNDASPDSVDTPEEEAAAADSEEEVDKRLAAKAEKERQRLEEEIKQIEGLSIGVSFTPGMKEARIKPLEEQLALLKADPKRYFRMKREGAFDNASGSGSGNGFPGTGGPLSGTLESREGLSAGSQSSNEQASSGEEDANAQSAEQAPSETDQSSGSRSSGPGASLKLPEE